MKMKRTTTRVFGLCALVIVMIFSVLQAEELKQTIADALKAGDTTKAISLLQQEIELDKSYHYNYYMLGRIYYNQGEYEKARDQFQKALKKKKKHYESLYYLGLCYLKLGEIDEAEKVMEKGRKKAKKDMKYMFENGYGLVMMEKGKYQEADLAFRQALIGDPDNAEYHINLGDANFYGGVPSLAISEYEKALQIDTASLEVYFHWAEACLEMRDYNCALEKLRTVLSKDSTHAPAWRRAGEIYFKAALSARGKDRVERFKETIGSYRRYLELSNAQPDSAHVRVFFELAMSYVNLSGFEEAANYFEKVLSIPYVPKDIYFYYGKSLFWTKQYEKAAEMLKKHIEWAAQQDENYKSRVSKAELYRLLGYSYYYRKPGRDYATAVTYYKKSLEVNPNQKRVLQNIAVAYHSMQSYAQALEYYKKRIEMGIDSTNASIFKNASYAALNLANGASDNAGEGDLGDELDEGSGETAAEPEELFKEAAEFMDQYLQFKPNDLKAILMVANTYLYQLTDCAKGVKYYEQALTVDPNSCDALKSLGYAYFGGICNKNYTKALKYLKKAYSCLQKDNSGPCADDPALVLWIAQCYHLRAVDKKLAQKDDFKNANTWYKKCIKCDPTNQECLKGRDDTEYEF